VGSNSEAAIISGIKSKRVLFMIYTIMGALAGLAGILWVSKYASAQGNTAAGYEMSVIAACVLGGVSVDGGVGRISGLVLGILFYGTLINSLPMLNVSPFVQQTIQALLILGAIVLNVTIKRRMKANNRRRRKI
jgi:rhamnose transport system permease protein